jgi:hypothetical protein
VKNKQRPYERRGGWLRNGNPPGDLSKATRCGAKTRRGTSCRCPGMANGRCRLHGGLSTGPRTAEGIDRIRRAVTKHGRYTAVAKAERRKYRQFMKEACALVKEISSGGADSWANTGEMTFSKKKEKEKKNGFVRT